MRISFSTLLAVATLLISASALPTGSKVVPVDESNFPRHLKGTDLFVINHKDIPFRTPGPNDKVARSPCPFMNSLANHDIIPFSGRDIKITWIARVLQKVGLSDRAAKPFIGGMDQVIAAGKQVDSNHPDDTIHLSDLNIHGIIEHDVSLTRPDVLDPAQRDALAKPDFKLIGDMFSHVSKFLGHDMKQHGLPTLTYGALGSWRKQRHAQEVRRVNAQGQKHEPKYGLSRAIMLGSGEAALLLDVFGQGGKVSGKDANTFLAKEHFPDGWKAHPMSLPQLLAGITKAAASSQLIPDTILGWFQEKQAPIEQAAASPETAKAQKSYVDSMKDAFSWAWTKTASLAPSWSKSSSTITATPPTSE